MQFAEADVKEKIFIAIKKKKPAMYTVVPVILF